MTTTPPIPHPEDPASEVVPDTTHGELARLDRDGSRRHQQSGPLHLDEHFTDLEAAARASRARALELMAVRPSHSCRLVVRTPSVDDVLVSDAGEDQA